MYTGRRSENGRALLHPHIPDPNLAAFPTKWIAVSRETSTAGSYAEIRTPIRPQYVFDRRRPRRRGACSSFGEITCAGRTYVIPKRFLERGTRERANQIGFRFRDKLSRG